MPNKSATIYSISLRPIRVCMYLLGILPYECFQKKPKPPNCIPKLMQTLWKFLHMLIIFCLISLISLQRDKFFNYVYTADDLISGAMDFIGFSTLVFVNFIAQAESTWKAHHYQLIFARFERMRAQFGQQLKITVNCALIRYLSVLLYVFFVFYWVCIIFLMLPLSKSLTPRLLPLTYSEVVLKLKLIECMIFVVIVLVMLSALCTAGEEFMLELQKTRFDPWLPRRRAALARIFILQDLHAMLWESVRQIEAYWEWSLPGLLLKVYLDCTLMAYWVYLSFICNTSFFIKTYCLGLMVLQFLTFVVITFLCFRCEQLDKKFRTLFHGISADRRNIYLSSCLRQMSLQLMHEPINFTAGGFVDLNKNTLGKVIHKNKIALVFYRTQLIWR